MDLEWLKLFFDGLVGDDPGYSEAEWAIKEIERLRERIEELEDDLRKEWLIGYAEAKDEDIGVFHIITRDQIRAAWKHTRLPHVMSVGAVNALIEFGIVRCEECGGNGGVERECIIGEHFVSHEMAIDAGMPEMEGSHHSYEYGSEEAPCPDCHGEGWRIGGEDE